MTSDRPPKATEPGKTFGARLRFARLAAGLSQHQLAQAVGVTSQTIHRLEKRTKPMVGDTLDSICRVLQVPDAWLSYGIGVGPAQKEPSEALAVVEDYLSKEGKDTPEDVAWRLRRYPFATLGLPNPDRVDVWQARNLIESYLRRRPQDRDDGDSGG